MTPTDAQLKAALAKMLPDELVYHAGFKTQLAWNTPDLVDVLDTELLHLCWLVEQSLGELWPVYYAQFVEFEGVTINASWQSRTIALANVNGIKL